MKSWVMLLWIASRVVDDASYQRSMWPIWNGQYRIIMFSYVAHILSEWIYIIIYEIARMNSYMLVVYSRSPSWRSEFGSKEDIPYWLKAHPTSTLASNNYLYWFIIIINNNFSISFSFLEYSVYFTYIYYMYHRLFWRKNRTP